MIRQKYPFLLEEHYVGRIRETYRARAKRVAAVRTADGLRRYCTRVRRALQAAFGRMPTKTPLNTKTWRTSEWGDHRIEHLTFESRPGMLVTANLYLPANATAPAPGVVLPCGHYGIAKAAPPYASACVRLARAGYAVLIYDPIAQGEREMHSHVDSGGRLTIEKGICDAHNILGRQLHTAGEWFGAWCLWDGIRATDLLAARPEVDASRLAVTGQSGGGTLSAYLWAMDPRFKAVASSCWCTSYLNDGENGMPADEEQYPPGFLAAGCDKIDFFTVRAGEPTLLLGQEQDFFDDRGLRAGYAELSRLHALAGGDPALCELSMDTLTHLYSEHAQVAMITFFNRVFGKGAPAPQRPVEERTPAELQVTSQGDVWMAGSRPMPEVAAERIRDVAAKRKPAAPDTLPSVIRKALGIPAEMPFPYHRRLFHLGEYREETKQQFLRFIVETESDLRLELRHICMEWKPHRLNAEPVSTLYLPDTDGFEELRQPGVMDGCEAFWCLDVRGLGFHMATPTDPYVIYGHDYMASGHAVLFGETLLGDRVRDVLTALKLLKAEGGARSFRLVGRRQGAVLALLAAALEPDVESVSCFDAPESFLALATAPFTFWPAVNFPRNVLKAFDLPDVRAFLGTRLIHDSHASPDEFPSLQAKVSST